MLSRLGRMEDRRGGGGEWRSMCLESFIDLNRILS